MVTKAHTLTIDTPARQEFFDLTQKFEEFVCGSGVTNGIAVAYSQHTSCCVLLQEESEDTTYYGTQYILQDTLNVLAKIAPPTRHENRISTLARSTSAMRPSSATSFRHGD